MNSITLKGNAADGFVRAAMADGEPPVRVQPVVRAPVHHVLKCWPEPFEAIGQRRKLFELRIDDRDFQEGDSVELREWDPQSRDYTQRWIWCRIGYVLRELFRFPGVKPGYCVWSINLPANHSWPRCRAITKEGMNNPPHECKMPPLTNGFCKRHQKLAAQCSNAEVSHGSEPLAAPIG